MSSKPSSLTIVLSYFARDIYENLQHSRFTKFDQIRERAAEWLRRLTRKPKVRTAVGSNPALDSLVAVRNSSPGQPEPCEGNLVATAGSCGGLMVKHPWPLLEISLSDFRRLATLNINTYLPTYVLRTGRYYWSRRSSHFYFKMETVNSFCLSTISSLQVQNLMINRCFQLHC